MKYKLDHHQYIRIKLINLISLEKISKKKKNENKFNLIFINCKKKNLNLNTYILKFKKMNSFKSICKNHIKILFYDIIFSILS